MLRYICKEGMNAAEEWEMMHAHSPPHTRFRPLRAPLPALGCGPQPATTSTFPGHGLGSPTSSPASTPLPEVLNSIPQSLSSPTEAPAHASAGDIECSLWLSLPIRLQHRRGQHATQGRYRVTGRLLPFSSAEAAIFFSEAAIFLPEATISPKHSLDTHFWRPGGD